jgi:hypothetical protein
MRIFFLISILLLAPVYASAQKVAVVPASYVKAGTGAESREAAEKVTERVMDGIRDAGREPSDPVAVKNAIAQVTGEEDGVCEDKECMSGLADLLYTDEAVFVRVVEKSEMEREVVMILGRGEGATETCEDGFMVVLERIRRNVALALQKTEARGHDEAAEPKTEPEPEPKKPEEPNQEKQKSGISPVGFYVSAGVASALAISWAIMESVGYARNEKLKDRVADDQWRDDKASLKKLQIADRVVLGAAVAGAVTTAVLFILTDFDTERTGDQRTGGSRTAPTNGFSVHPAITENGGALVIEGRF